MSFLSNRGMLFSLNANVLFCTKNSDRYLVVIFQWNKLMMLCEHLLSSFIFDYFRNIFLKIFIPPLWIFKKKRYFSSLRWFFLFKFGNNKVSFESGIMINVSEILPKKFFNIRKFRFTVGLFLSGYRNRVSKIFAPLKAFFHMN